MAKVKAAKYIESFQNIGKKNAIKGLDNFLYPGDSLYVHEETGLVTSSLNSTPKEILDYWSNKIFTSKSIEDYSAHRPFAVGRLMYVVRFLIDYISANPNCSGKFFCDFATGQGVLPRLLKMQPEAREWDIGCTEGSLQLHSDMVLLDTNLIMAC